MGKSLIAQNENELVFVEVKTRLNTNFGYASDCVPPYKIKKLMYSAEKYLSQKQLKPENYRIDVVGIDYDHGKLEIEHIVDALI
ncbi:MAG: hypothetical protein UR28_C0008G0011 [Candidatus Peregrinibacteria bacterium GW2011_GWF2_33_10]|nr:MAG: hypothetical protein UR28_C0008G0011 [Candidatus Peregrinibacteria bacterium GW2011_GWF2_33_10]